MSATPDVRLARVDDDVIEQLLGLACRDAAPDEVTPPLGIGEGWNPERIEWFRAYHRAAAAGFDGPAQQKTWAIMLNGVPAGSIRLKRVDAATAETGIWLGRAYRGRGIGSASLLLILSEARRAGLNRVVAATTSGNVGAQRILASAGAVLTADGGGVSAVVVLPH